jgi:transposase
MSLENLKSRSDLSLDEIIRLMESEDDVRIFKKLLYFKFKAMGFTKIESYELASIKRSTAYYLEDLWHEGGYNALLHKSGQGRKSKLTDEQIEELGEILETKDAWLVTDVLKLIEEKWSIKYSYNGTQNLLKTHFNINIDNYHQNMQNKKKNTMNVVQNFDNIDSDEKTEIETIINYIKTEKRFDTLKRLFYILFRKLGFSTDLVSYFLSVTPATGNNWLKRWENEEYMGLVHKKGQGRKPKLSDENLEYIKKTK